MNILISKSSTNNAVLRHCSSQPIGHLIAKCGPWVTNLLFPSWFTTLNIAVYLIWKSLWSLKFDIFHPSLLCPQQALFAGVCYELWPAPVSKHRCESSASSRVLLSAAQLCHLSLQCVLTLEPCSHQRCSSPLVCYSRLEVSLSLSPSANPYYWPINLPEILPSP